MMRRSLYAQRSAYVGKWWRHEKISGYAQSRISYPRYPHPVRFLHTAPSQIHFLYSWFCGTCWQSSPPALMPPPFDSYNCRTLMQYLCLHISAWYLTCCALCRQLHILSWLVPRQPASFGERPGVIPWLIMNADWRFASWLTEGLTVWGMLHWWWSFPQLPVPLHSHVEELHG